MDRNVAFYLLGRRAFVAIDEWLSYFVLLKLYYDGHYNLALMLIPLLFGANLYGYISLWKLYAHFGVQKQTIESVAWRSVVGWCGRVVW